MYCRQRHHLYYGGEIYKYYLPPSTPFMGGLRCQAIQTEHGPYIAERTQKAVYIMRYLEGRPIESNYPNGLHTEKKNNILTQKF
jgi:hypothetical protein